MRNTKVSAEDNKGVRASVTPCFGSARPAQSQLSKSVEFVELWGPEQPHKFSWRMEAWSRESAILPAADYGARHVRSCEEESEGRSPHLSVSGCLVSGELVFPQQAAPQR